MFERDERFNWETETRASISLYGKFFNVFLYSILCEKNKFPSLVLVFRSSVIFIYIQFLAKTHRSKFYGWHQMACDIIWSEKFYSLFYQWMKIEMPNYHNCERIERPAEVIGNIVVKWNAINVRLNAVCRYGDDSKDGGGDDDDVRWENG